MARWFPIQFGVEFEMRTDLAKYQKKKKRRKSIIFDERENTKQKVEIGTIWAAAIGKKKSKWINSFVFSKSNWERFVRIIAKRMMDQDLKTCHSIYRQMKNEQKYNNNNNYKTHESHTWCLFPLHFGLHVSLKCLVLCAMKNVHDVCLCFLLKVHCDRFFNVIWWLLFTPLSMHSIKFLRLLILVHLLLLLMPHAQSLSNQCAISYTIKRWYCRNEKMKKKK